MPHDFGDTSIHWRKRFKPYVTSRGYSVLPLYYAMVPKYDPERDGKEWLRNKKISMSDKEFRQEHEIDFAAVKGGLVYPKWAKQTHVLWKPIPLQKHWLYQCAIDPGVTITAAMWQAIVPIEILPDGRRAGGWVINFDEYYVGDGVKGSESISANKHAIAIKERTQLWCDRIFGKDHNGKSLKDGQAWIQTTLMDPSSWRRESSSNDLGSIFLRYEEEGIRTLEKGSPKTNVDGGIEKVKSLEDLVPESQHPNRVIDRDGIGFPTKFCFPDMRYFIAEKKKYQYKDGGGVRKKDDHLCDCERMLAVHAHETVTVKKKRPLSTIGQKLQQKKRNQNERKMF
jgi:hypothetical protein